MKLTTAIALSSCATLSGVLALGLAGWPASGTGEPDVRNGAAAAAHAPLATGPAAADAARALSPAASAGPTAPPLRFIAVDPLAADDQAGTVRRPTNSFVFTRAIYSGRGRGGWGGRGRGSWATDYPKADNQFNVVLQRLVDIDAYGDANAITLDDPDVRRFPMLYALEVGGMAMTAAEVAGLRSYLLQGGFLMIDDFWGTSEWRNFEREIRRVLPEYQIQEIPLDHPIFSAFYQIDTIIQVPAVGNWRGGRTWEGDGVTPHVRGIFDDDGRLLVAINWNTDLGDAWEWAEQPDYPLEFSTYAFQVGVNYIVYAMSH
ncbi:MAG: DUF4159 domain-containing protein [Gemmatimonadota bacterium]